MNVLLCVGNIRVYYYRPKLQEEREPQYDIVSAGRPLYCLFNALWQHWTEYEITRRVRSPMSDLRPECEKLRTAITQQRVIRSTSCLALGWVFLQGQTSFL